MEFVNMVAEESSGVLEVRNQQCPKNPSEQYCNVLVPRQRTEQKKVGKVKVLLGFIMECGLPSVF
jgi:hypothetical protein